MKALVALAVGLMAAPIAQAQDENSSRKDRRDFENEVVREVVRGVYMKSGAGSQQFLGVTLPGGFIRPVVAMNLAVGQDFIDRERLSVAWEISIQQALHNGPKFEELPLLPGIVQGDIHTFGGLAFIEASGYVTRRFGIGVRGGGGMTLAPILMEPTAYNEEVVVGQWGGLPGVAHAGPIPTFGGGPTIEYYTKLSHFSVGADIDVLYLLGLDLALSPVGYLKYTF